MATASSLSTRLGARIRELGLKRGSTAWYGPHMAAAERAILDRVTLVDLVLEVRDARLLNNIRYRIKQLKAGESNYTATVLLVGIPNVGKSALANSIHQIGRIGAAEKGKLKQAIVSPLPGETKDISSYKIASHPNIYVLDTPGILYPRIADDDSASKLALTGAIKDSLVGNNLLAQYFLYLLNSSGEYKRWEVLTEEVAGASSLDREGKLLVGSECSQRKRKQYASDHTQDFIVKNVHQTLFKTLSSFKGNLEDEHEFGRLIEDQFTALYKAFRLSTGTGGDGPITVATKLLNLYRTGRLGRYTLDHVPGTLLEPTSK